MSGDRRTPIPAYNRGMVAHLAGSLLIAAADMQDPNFSQTVTLLVECSDESVLGLVLNRPSELTVRRAWDDTPDKPVTTPCHHTGWLHVGGPCPGPLFAIHTHEDRAQWTMKPGPSGGVYVTADPEDLGWLMEHNQGPMKVVANYAGWAPGQLLGEIEQNAWLLTPATKAEVFEAGPNQWLDLLGQVNPTQAALVRNPHLVPRDPSHN